MDLVISNGQLCDFLAVFWEKHKEKVNWDFFLNKLGPWDERSWDDFLKSVDTKKQKDISDEEKADIIKQSKGIWDSFNEVIPT